MIVAGMATMPSRAHTAPRALASSILPQVDRLWLCLDGFDSVPSFARHRKIIVEHGAAHGGLKAEGKLLGLALDDEAKAWLCVDDDLQYPRDYVRRLLRYCRLFPHAAFGCHGSVFKPKITSFVRDRDITVIDEGQKALWRRVDLLATNGSLHLTRTLRFDVRKWTFRNQVDLNFLEECRRARVQGYTVRRARRWVRALDRDQPDSIYMGLRANDRVQTDRINHILGRRRVVDAARG
jgi:hypothetical protein